MVVTVVTAHKGVQLASAPVQQRPTLRSGLSTSTGGVRAAGDAACCQACRQQEPPAAEGGTQGAPRQGRLGEATTPPMMSTACRGHLSTHEADVSNLGHALPRQQHVGRPAYHASAQLHVMAAQGDSWPNQRQTVPRPSAAVQSCTVAYRSEGRMCREPCAGHLTCSLPGWL